MSSWGILNVAGDSGLVRGQQDVITSYSIHYTKLYEATLVQIAILDIIFSLDSVITAVGMADHVPVMILAIIVAVGVMMFAAKPIGDFVDEHPTLKMLALAFLILVGVALIAEGFDLP